MKLSRAKIKKGIKVIARKIKNFRPYKYYRTRYFWYREHKKLQLNWILLESVQEKQPIDKIASILEELATNPIYKEYKIYLAGNKNQRNNYKEYLKQKGLEDKVILLNLESLFYYKVLATAKYIISQNRLSYVYIKREGQVYLNMWNETPAKTLGRNSEDNYAMLGEEQKSLLDADYIVCPNQDTMNHIIEDYMLENFGQAKVLLTGDFKKEVITALGKRLLLEEQSSLIEEKDIPYNGKKNIMFYIGGFEKNGLTTAGLNLLYNLDKEKYNCGVIYPFQKLKKHPEEIKALPSHVSYFGYYDLKMATISEAIRYSLWKETGKIPYSFVQSAFERMSKRMSNRIFSSCRIHHMVQFTGYVEEMVGMAEQMPCKRTIYVHNDMEKEIRTRGNANKGLLSHAYKAYDNVAAVTEGMIPPTKRIAESVTEAGLKQADIHLCKNVIDYKRIVTLGEKPLAFDEVTEFSVPKEQLLEVLYSDKKKFISVGRFSPEKGHERLIRAFEQFHKEQPDTYLIIVGGHGVLYQKTLNMIKESSCPNHMFLVKYMSNPYPLVKLCDYFVLSSLYEGFGLVLVEADILGLPCFSADITGPRYFMKEYGGTLVEDSQNGILEGMRACINGAIPKRLNIDYEQYNKEAIEQFEGLL